MDDWENKMTEQERHFVKTVLAFFAASDGIVNENLVSRRARDRDDRSGRARVGLSHKPGSFAVLDILDRPGSFAVLDILDRPGSPFLS